MKRRPRLRRVNGFELRDAAAFLDFDGTVTVEDTCTHLLRRLAPSGWEAAGREYRAGRIDGRTCLTREWAMLPHDLDRLLLRADLDEAGSAGFGSGN